MNKPENQQAENNRSFFSEWLEKLQQESWQLELLISGLALYGVFESKSLLIDFHSYINLYTEGTFHIVLNTFYKVLSVGWRLFLINLLVHIVLRGLWIGSIGLRYVSGDINFKELNYSNLFTEYLKKRIGSYDEYIERLEKFCSVLFAYTFLLFFLFFSFILYFTFMGLVKTLMDSFFPDSQMMFFSFFVIIYLLLGLIVFIDLITLGGFKKVRETSVSKVYFVIYRFINIITLSFLYRPLLYNFLDQRYTKRLFFFSIPYILIIAFGTLLFDNSIYTYVENNENLLETGLIIDDDYYQDLRNNNLQYLDKSNKKKLNLNLPYIVLDKFYMDRHYPSLFFKMTKYDKELLKKDTSITPIYEEGIQFVFFNAGKSERAKDTTKSVLKLNLDSLHIKRRALKKLYRSTKKTKNTNEIKKLTDEIDSIDVAIKISRKAFQKDQNSRKKNNYLGVIKSFMSHITLKIDSINYKTQLNCKYYTHPSSGYKGFLCHFNSDSITEGFHTISFKRNYYRNKEDSLKTYQAELPFIKIK